MGWTAWALAAQIHGPAGAPIPLDFSNPSTLLGAVIVGFLAIIANALLSVIQYQGVRKAQTVVAEKRLTDQEELLQGHRTLADELGRVNRSLGEKITGVAGEMDSARRALSDKITDTQIENKAIREEQGHARERLHAIAGDVHAALVRVAVVEARADANEKRLDRIQTSLDAIMAKLDRALEMQR